MTMLHMRDARNGDSPQVRNVKRESEAMIGKGTHTGAEESACETALAEERRLWRAIHDTNLKAIDRVLAYARWRGLVNPLADLPSVAGPWELIQQR